MTRPYHLIIILCILFLSGCTHQPSILQIPRISQNWPQHEAQIHAIHSWQATGKLGVKTPTDGGSLTLHWQQQMAEYHIALNGPFGQGNLSIEGSPDQVTFKGGGTPPQSAKTAEELILKNTGWHIPVAQLAFWIRGLPAPDTKITRLTPNAQGLIGELEQAGWTITYGDYLTIPNTIDTLLLPGRITAEYQEVRLTLLIRTWNLGETQ